MADSNSFDLRFENACLNALNKFKLDEFKDIQRKALKEVILGKDVFVILPTGSGKSLIFQTAPIVFDHMEGSTEESIVLVISPLVSLMRDQVNFLLSKGIKAAFLGEEQEDEQLKKNVEKGKYQVVYGSPETFLLNKRWRSMLINDVYRRKLRLLCVDEAHCISHWGFSTKKGEKAFRIWFSRINEIRSLVTKIPMLALTATATKNTRRRITQTLEMEKAIIFTSSPNRRNIGYAVELTSCEVRKTFSGIIEELKTKKMECQRVIIYCPRISIVSQLYGIFKAELGDSIYANGDSLDPKQRTLEMFHARVDELNKEEILTSFAKEDGVIRVLIATIAYGMGIDCKGVKTVIHYGPPRNLEAYLQESGRAGRSGEDGCKSIILYSNVMLQHCNEDIVEYVRNDTQCRRRALLAHFDCESDDCSYENLHECCDICQRQCHCAGESICDYQYFDTVVPLQSQTNPVKERTATAEDTNQLIPKLDYLKKSLNNSYSVMASSMAYPLFTPVNLVSGFGDRQIIQVVENIKTILALEDVYKYVDIWHNDIAIEILYVINSVFGDIQFDFEENESEDEDIPDTGFWDCHDDDDELLVALSGFSITEDFLEGFDSAEAEEGTSTV